MPRIPQRELDELKRTVSLATLAESQGHQLRKQGKDLVLLCPFHQESTPSCVITPAKNLYHCFGCGAAGSVVDWIMKTENFSLPKAVLRLREFAGQPLPSLAAAVPPPVPRQTLTDLDDDGQALLHQVTDWYHQNLLNSPETLAWLEKRGLNHPELVSYFRLGFAGAHGVAGELPSPYGKAGKALRQRLTGLGVIRESNRQDHFRGCLVVPVIGSAESYDPLARGRVQQLYGRRTLTDSQIKKASAKHLYLPSPLTGVWKVQAVLNLDGSYNDTKTKAARAEGRRLPK